MINLPVNILTGDDQSFKVMAKENGIVYEERKLIPGAMYASGDAIKILQVISDSGPWLAIAWVLVTWLKQKATRKAMITTKKKEVIHLEGYSIDDVAKFLEQSDHVNILDTKPKKKT
jgi:hypothetical protein